jgi:hypothetical protein
MSIVLRAFPIRGPVEKLHDLVASLKGEKQPDADSFFKSYGVSHESWHLQDTPAGPWVIGLTVIDDPKEAAPRYAKAVGEFDSWFKAQIGHVTGVDLNVEPLGPPTELIYAWSDSEKPNAALL